MDISNVGDILPALPPLERIGIPEQLKPAEFPFPPIPRGLLMKAEGLSRYKAYSVNSRGMEELGDVWGEDYQEAMEAAENLARVEGIHAGVKVIRA